MRILLPLVLIEQVNVCLFSFTLQMFFPEDTCHCFTSPDASKQKEKRQKISNCSGMHISNKCLVLEVLYGIDSKSPFIEFKIEGWSSE